MRVGGGRKSSGVRVEGGKEFISDIEKGLWARHEDCVHTVHLDPCPRKKFRWLVHMARQTAPLGHQDFVRILDYRQGVVIVETCGVEQKRCVGKQRSNSLSSTFSSHPQ